MKSGGSRRAACRRVAGPADAPCGHGPRSPRPCCGASTQAAPRDPPLHTHPHTPHTTHPQPPAEGLTAIELSVAASIFDGVSSRTLTSRLSSWLVVANNNSTSLAGKDLPPFATTKASLPWLENTGLGFRVQGSGFEARGLVVGWSHAGKDLPPLPWSSQRTCRHLRQPRRRCHG